MKTLKLIAEMTTAELLQEYNETTGRLTTKFASRAAGEKAVSKLRSQNQSITEDENMTQQEKEQLDMLEQILGEDAKEESLPESGGIIEDNRTDAEKEDAKDEAIEGKTSKVIVNDKSGSIGKKTKAEKAPKAEKTSEEKAAAEKERKLNLSMTWADPDIKAARTSRVGVAVSINGTEPVEFDSVGKAFAALGLPQNKFPMFRTQMRKSESGSRTFVTGTESTGDKIEYIFTAIEKGNPAEAKKEERIAKAAEAKAAKEAKAAEKLAAKAVKKAAKAKPEAEEVQGDLGDIEEV